MSQTSSVVSFSHMLATTFLTDCLLTDQKTIDFQKREPEVQKY